MILKGHSQGYSKRVQQWKMGTSIWVLSCGSHPRKGHHPEVHASLAWDQGPGPSSAISKNMIYRNQLSFLDLGQTESIFFSSLSPRYAFYGNMQQQHFICSLNIKGGVGPFFSLSFPHLRRDQELGSHIPLDRSLPETRDAKPGFFPSGYRPPGKRTRSSAVAI